MKLTIGTGAAVAVATIHSMLPTPASTLSLPGANSLDAIAAVGSLLGIECDVGKECAPTESEFAQRVCSSVTYDVDCPFFLAG